MSGTVHLERSFSSVADLRRAFVDAGCEQVLIKMLSPHQDNEKNQVYLGTDDLMLSLLPGRLSYSAASESTGKRHSQPGVGKEILQLSFSWLWAHGSYPAPEAKVIYYFQYPESRFSGFLRGCQHGPQALRRGEQKGYGRRVLLLGISGDEVYGAVVSDVDGPGLVDQLAESPVLPGQTIMRVLDMPTSTKSSNLEKLLSEVTGIAGRWHPAMSLSAGSATPTLRQSNQGSGWTLEALLGIQMNAQSGPDKYGYEIKAIGSTSPVSVITSEPDFGYRKEMGLTQFLQDFGWPGTKNDGSQRFNGAHNTRRPYPKSGAIVRIDHWDAAADVPDGTGDPTVLLVHQLSGTVLAGWKFETLANKWSKKHSGCVYVEYHRWPKIGGPATHYLYGLNASCGLGTSINHLLRALSDSAVYFDPGDRVLADGAEKKRMQWRVGPTKESPLVEQLSHLYKAWETHTVGLGRHPDIRSFESVVSSGP